jgi:hypothetical protein
VLATVVIQEPHVDGSLGNRASRGPLPRLAWLHPTVLNALIPTKRIRAQETEQPGRSCGTYVAHKSEKRCSAGSVSVNGTTHEMADFRPFMRDLWHS